MIKQFFAISILLLTSFHAPELILGPNQTYDEYIEIWNENTTLAKSFMKESMKSLDNGDALDSCFNQRKASEYGYVATLARIEAAKLNEEEVLIPNLMNGLEKWKAFGDSCS